MKRIVICADGTWNTRDNQVDKKTGRLHPTNVTKVVRAVLPQAKNGTPQVVYYHEGVGTSENDIESSQEPRLQSDGSGPPSEVALLDDQPIGEGRQRRAKVKT